MWADVAISFKSFSDSPKNIENRKILPQILIEIPTVASLPRNDMLFATAPLNNNLSVYRHTGRGCFTQPLCNTPVHCRKAALRIFPLMVLGISATNSMMRIHLYSARRWLQNSLISNSSSREG